MYYQNKALGADVSGQKLLIALGGGIALALVSGLAIGFVIRDLVPVLSDVDWLATVIVSVVCIAILAVHIVVFGGFVGLRHTLRLTPTSWSEVGIALGLWLAVWVAALLVYAVLAPVAGLVQEAGITLLRVGALYGRLHQADVSLIVAGLIQTVLLVPLLEEVVLRGALFGWLRKRLTAQAAIVLTATLFALYHPPAVWPLLFAFGLAAGWLREHMGSITPFLIVHMLNSVAMITASYLLVGWNVPMSH